MTISGSSFRAFISKLKSKPPALQKPGRAKVNMQSTDSFDLVENAKTKGINAHIAELLASNSKIQYVIPERYFNDPKLQSKFIKKLIATENPAAIHQYFSQLANKYPVNSRDYHDTMQNGLILQEQIYLKRMARNPLTSSSLKHFWEIRDSKKQLQSIRYEQQQLSKSLKPSLYDILHTETQIKTTAMNPQKVNSFKDELDTGFDINWSLRNKSASEKAVETPTDDTKALAPHSENSYSSVEDLHLKNRAIAQHNSDYSTPSKPMTSPTEEARIMKWREETPEVLLNRQSTGLLSTPLSSDFSRTESQRSSKTSRSSMSNEARYEEEHFPILLEGDDRISKLTLKRDSMASNNDNTDFIPITYQANSTKHIQYTRDSEAQSKASPLTGSTVIKIGYKTTPEELIQMRNQKHKSLNETIADNDILPRTTYKPS
jgi:hypothetical protein